MLNSELWLRTILSTDATIEEAIQVLNKTSLRIILITMQEQKLLGTLSDGDIRRALMAGSDLKTPIGQIINKNPLVVSREVSRKVVLKMMIENKIQQIPIVDKQNRVTGLHLWDEMTETPSKSNIIVIMAGGMGTRLHPQTSNCPKPLLPIGGKPIIEHIICRARAEGFSEFVVAIHHLGYMIEDYLGNGEKLGVKISYLREELPLGTAGALSLISPIPEFAFIVTNGDVLTDIRYEELLNFHEFHRRPVTMAVRLHEVKNPFGVVQIQESEVIDYEEKPIDRNFINAGIYAFNPEILRLFHGPERIDMSVLMQNLLEQDKKIGAFPIHENWLDVGSPSDFLEAVDKFSINSIKKEE
jgi:dTDP-glucose pyrophosphorylase